MVSAHRLTERDIWAKLTINRSKGSEDIERTQSIYVRTYLFVGLKWS